MAHTSSMPLNKRIPRSIKNNLGRSIGLLLLLVFCIGLGYGNLQTAVNVRSIMDGSRDAYNVEDGRFTTGFKASGSAIDAVEDLGVKVYRNFSKDLAFSRQGSDSDVDITMRVYENRGEDCDVAAYADGSAPTEDDQVALDRVFMANNGIVLGDRVVLGDREYTVCGSVTLPDYQALFENNQDLLFNAVTFGVAQVTPEAFEELDGGTEHYTYSFMFPDRNMSTADRVSLEEDIANALGDHGCVVTSMVDYEYNQGISYPASDNDGDQSTYRMLTIILTIILAFIFLMLTSANIEQESSAIGTLLAMGYRKGELLRHYLAVPVLVGVVGCVAGFLLGATVEQGVMVDQYYGSYSLPPYVAHFSPGVFAVTVLLPFALLVLINYFGLKRKLRYTPLQFLRHEFSKQKKLDSVHLSDKLSFPAKLRLRVLIRNRGLFVMLLVGIFFANVLLLFSLCTMPMIRSYTEMRKSELVAEHQYVLKDALELEGSGFSRAAFGAAEDLATSDLASMDYDNMPWQLIFAQTVDEHAHAVNRYENSQEAIDQAEKFATTELQVSRKMNAGEESVTVYGIQPDSAYWKDYDVSDGKVVVDAGVLEKCDVKLGETARFTDKTTGKSYDLDVGSATSARASSGIYMDIDTFNALFDHDADYFNGYVSNMPLNIDEMYLMQDMTPDQIDKIAEQMDSTFGSIMGIILVFCIPIYLVLIYLLTKTVIDRNARSVSYMKVFGYENKRIDRLYVRLITGAVFVSLIVSIPILSASIASVFRIMLMSLNGNFVASIPPSRLAVDLVICFASYFIVAFFHVRHIKKIPLSLALKVQE